MVETLNYVPLEEPTRSTTSDSYDSHALSSISTPPREPLPKNFKTQVLLLTVSTLAALGTLGMSVPQNRELFYRLLETALNKLHGD